MGNELNEKKYYIVKQARNAADTVRITLFNYDLEITACQGRFNMWSEKFSYLNETKDKFENKGLELSIAVANLKREEAFLKNLRKGRKEVEDKLYEVLQRYNPSYQKIWVAHFISGLNASEIAEKDNEYSERHIARLLSDFRKDLIEYFAGDMEKQMGENNG